MILYRVGDILPQLSILVMDGGTVTNLTTLDVYVRWQKPDGTLIPERQAVPATDPTTGIANYVWVNGDLDQVGIYRAIIQLSPQGNPVTRYSLTNPPLTEIEVLANDFSGADTTLPLIPTPTGEEVAAILHTTVTAMDGTLLTQSIDRARTLTYTYAELWRCPALVLDPVGQRMARELVAILAATGYATNPMVLYGPLKKETIGSYSYEMRDPQALKPGQVASKTGNPQADSIISYLMWICRAVDPNVGGIEIIFPDYVQPVTTTIEDPLLPIGNPPFPRQ